MGFVCSSVGQVVPEKSLTEISIFITLGVTDSKSGK